MAVSFAWGGINGTSGRTSAAVMSRSLRVQFGFYKQSSTADGQTALVVGRLQKRYSSTGTWSDTGQTSSTAATLFDFRINPYSSSSTMHDVSVYYRLVVPTGGVIGRGSVSPQIRVDYQNPSLYTGWKRSLYLDMRQFCPDAAIRGLSSLPVAWAAAVTPRGLYEIDVLSSDRVTMTASNQKAMMLHECGHHLQWQNYGASGTGWNLMSQQATKIFGTNHSQPIEHMADCVSHAAYSAGYLGYGGVCTTTQLSYAARILAGKELY
ncbi:hypothetical protein QDR37_11280 [Amnibacterium sp. CER49]|uniref:hypothetical protein n=1 Tax=Amnibacterium sp. CER49 TaxID=3039161 RepID=UPI00244A74DD|nr:hypothetical protein [Amnibacterium sp. CER49]MDH2444527.1 hypothetical protein [Amnibacterium sp. CER49]